MLNRDTWANETVEALLRNSFVFWQRGSTSVDARAYMQVALLTTFLFVTVCYPILARDLYLFVHNRLPTQVHNVVDAQLPHIAIVDARTNSKIHVLKVAMLLFFFFQRSYSLFLNTFR